MSKESCHRIGSKKWGKLLVFLKKWNHILSNEEIRKYINHDIVISSDSSDEEIFVHSHLDCVVIIKLIVLMIP